jgi:PleD family two-component response regulator
VLAVVLKADKTDDAIANIKDIDMKFEGKHPKHKKSKKKLKYLMCSLNNRITAADSKMD